MFFNIKTLGSAFLLGGTQVLGHMIMQSPVPYGVSTLDNSPLDASGSDFPCKQRAGVYDITKMNKMAVDTPQSLTFKGSASHGGGTCQLSLTKDKKPTKDSDFRVILTIEGGCPTSSSGNSGSTPFTYKIPKGMGSGEYTLAWTWYNKVGNRELYMNCAPVTVTGGSDNDDVLNSLPRMYVINIPTSDCQSVESSDLQIPAPGPVVQKSPQATLKPATGPKCAALAKALTAGVSGGDQTSPASSQSSPAQATSAPAKSAATSSPSGMTTVTSSAAAAPDSSSAAASAPVSYPTLSLSDGAGVSGPASTGSAATPPAGTGSAGSSGGMRCSTDGTKFSLTGSSVWQAVAPGTSCKGGQIVKRSEIRNAHVRRHARNVGSFHEA